MNKKRYCLFAVALFTVLSVISGCSNNNVEQGNVEWEKVENEIIIPDEENADFFAPEVEETTSASETTFDMISSEDGLFYVESTKRDGVKVPAYLELPEGYDSNKGCVMVVMLPGLGGNHDNNGGFRFVMDNLLQNNVAVLSIDFAGCGLSEEPQTQYSISTMKRDVIDSVAYVKEHYKINKIGVYGYSIGGRVTLELIGEERFIPDSMVLVAPATYTRSIQAALGGEESWNTLVAQVTNDGVTSFGGREYGVQFFVDLLDLTDGIAERAANVYEGSSEIIYANDDEIVENSLSIVNGTALGSKMVEINWPCGHKYIFNGSADEETIRVCNQYAVEFLNSELKK